MIPAILIATLLVLLSIFIHYEALRGVSGLMPRMTWAPRSRLMLVIFVAMLAHLVEIGLFAMTYWAMESFWSMGALTGQVDGLLHNFWYFSASTYTTLGMGDIAPIGDMRVVAAVESLIGLVLIGWSTSFTYLAMREFWDLH